MNRVLTAVVLIPLVLAAVLWAPDMVFALLLLLVAFAAVREFYELAQAQGHQPYRWVGLAATAAIVMREAVNWAAAPGFDLILVAAVLAVLVRMLMLPDRIPSAVGDAGATVLGVLYPGLLIALLGAIRSYPGGAFWLVFLLIVVWVGDTAALYAGKAFGSRPMAPRVSPNKTWEGALASVLGSVVAGVAFGLWARLGGLLPLLSLAVLANAAAQAGDLIESVFKRGAQVKDSGGLLPGHGGVLDRMDALLFAAPILWYYLYFHI